MEDFIRLLTVPGVQFPNNLRRDYGEQICGLPLNDAAPVIIVHDSMRLVSTLTAKIGDAIRKGLESHKDGVVVLFMKMRSGNPLPNDLPDLLVEHCGLSQEEVALVTAFRVFYGGKEVISDLTEVNAALRVLAEGVNPIDPIEEQIARLDIASLSPEHRAQLRALLEKTLGEL